MTHKELVFRYTAIFFTSFILTASLVVIIMGLWPNTAPYISPIAVVIAIVVTLVVIWRA